MPNRRSPGCVKGALLRPSGGPHITCGPVEIAVLGTVILKKARNGVPVIITSCPLQQTAEGLTKDLGGMARHTNPWAVHVNP